MRKGRIQRKCLTDHWLGQPSPSGNCRFQKPSGTRELKNWVRKKYSAISLVTDCRLKLIQNKKKRSQTPTPHPWLPASRPRLWWMSDAMKPFVCTEAPLQVIHFSFLPFIVLFHIGILMISNARRMSDKRFVTKRGRWDQDPGFLFNSQPRNNCLRTY